MTLKDIRAMFDPGTCWYVMNTFRPQVNGKRRVEKRMLHEIRWKSLSDSQLTLTYFPKSLEQVIDARDGYLHYRMFTDQQLAEDARRSKEHTLTFTRLT